MLLASACSTSYNKQMQNLNGYSQKTISGNILQVSFGGKKCLSKEKVEDFALLRSAEIIKYYKFNYFIILEDNTKVYNKKSKNNKVIMAFKKLEDTSVIKNKEAAVYNVDSVINSITTQYDLLNNKEKQYVKYIAPDKQGWNLFSTTIFIGIIGVATFILISAMSM